jgi:hypothetical protein
LQAEDHLSNPETLDFWRRYFPATPPDALPLDQFCDAVQAEFSLSVFKPLF